MRLFAFLEEFERIATSGEIIIRRRVFKNESAGHVEAKAFGHRPTALGADRGARSDLILGDHVVNGATDLAETSREDALWSAKAELHKVAVVNVQVEQSAAGEAAVQEEFLSPGGRLGDAPEARGQKFAVGILVDGLLQPDPLRPETEAHRRHQKRRGSGRGVGDFARRPGRSRQRFFANHVFGGLERGDGQFGVRVCGGADIDKLNFRILEHIAEVAIGPHSGHIEPEWFGGTDISHDR